LNNLLTKFDQTGTVDCKPGSGKKCMTQITQKVDSVEKLVFSRKCTGIHRTIRPSSDSKRQNIFKVHKIEDAVL